MSRFDETVAKIAASPTKRAAFKLIPRALLKQAGMLGAAADAAEDAVTSPWANVLPDIAKNVGSGAALGAGAWGVGKGLDHFDQTSDRLEAERKQIGQLSGEQKFRADSLKGLAPMHDEVFAGMGQDAILAKADPELVNSSYQTMKRFAPHLAADPNATRAFLRESALYGAGPSYATLKTLADAEQSVSRAGGMG
jgi:hypothetical protein